VRRGKKRFGQKENRSSEWSVKIRGRDRKRERHPQNSMRVARGNLPQWSAGSRLCCGKERGKEI